jgi:hypothetical protein
MIDGAGTAFSTEQLGAFLENARNYYFYLRDSLSLVNGSRLTNETNKAAKSESSF